MVFEYFITLNTYVHRQLGGFYFYVPKFTYFLQMISLLVALKHFIYIYIYLAHFMVAIFIISCCT
jgi:hypothetical protein